MTILALKFLYQKHRFIISEESIIAKMTVKLKIILPLLLPQAWRLILIKISNLDLYIAVYI
jgi:hypothetical protein